MNLHGYYRIFSWIYNNNIFVFLKIYGYEYEYAKFLWILSMGSVVALVPIAHGPSPSFRRPIAVKG
jgi:hypothetical protein